MIVRFSEEEVRLMQTALDRWGMNAQVGQAVEECAELIVALQKYVRQPESDAIDSVLDEMADVEMMLAQMRIVFSISDDAYRERIARKFERLNHYLLDG